jgi:hypothetical protein
MGKIDLAKRTLAYQSPEAIIANILEIFVGELVEQFLVGIGKL